MLAIQEYIYNHRWKFFGVLILLEAIAGYFVFLSIYKQMGAFGPLPKEIILLVFALVFIGPILGFVLRFFIFTKVYYPWQKSLEKTPSSKSKNTRQLILVAFLIFLGAIIHAIFSNEKRIESIVLTISLFFVLLYELIKLRKNGEKLFDGENPVISKQEWIMLIVAFLLIVAIITFVFFAYGF